MVVTELGMVNVPDKPYMLSHKFDGIRSTPSPNLIVRILSWGNGEDNKSLHEVAFQTILFKPLQRPKTSSPMLLTEFPIVTVVKPIQSANASRPIVVTELGISRLVKPLQFLNAWRPMDVIVLGMVNEVKPLP